MSSRPRTINLCKGMHEDILDGTNISPGICGKRRRLIGRFLRKARSDTSAYLIAYEAHRERDRIGRFVQGANAHEISLIWFPGGIGKGVFIVLIRHLLLL